MTMIFFYKLRRLTSELKINLSKLPKVSWSSQVYLRDLQMDEWWKSTQDRDKWRLLVSEDKTHFLSPRVRVSNLLFIKTRFYLLVYFNIETSEKFKMLT